jgi:hypothetical protein
LNGLSWGSERKNGYQCHGHALSEYSKIPLNSPLFLEDLDICYPFFSMFHMEKLQIYLTHFDIDGLRALLDQT